jgi:fermentation-respiration switch protein FrsA (DUF1100 family)
MIRQIFLIILLLITIFFTLRYYEKNSIYYPKRELGDNPASFNLLYEEVNLPLAGNFKLNAWYIPAEGAHWSVLFCHGNAGNISHRLDKIRLLHSLAMNVLIFDYNGYGKSTGSPSEKALYEDARVAYQYMTGQLKIPPERIILYGESLGTAVAVDLAARKKVGGLILEGAFTSAKEMAGQLFPYVVPFFLASRFDSLAKISQVNAPILVIHSSQDEIVPIGMAEKLFSAAKTQKAFLRLKGGHNESFFIYQEIVRQKIAEFFKNAGKR